MQLGPRSMHVYRFLVGCTAALVLLGRTAPAQTTQGFNFRASNSYVTDASDETYDVGAVYPVTRNGRTFGWEIRGSGWLTRNRNSAIDRRLAGLFGQANAQGKQSTWRLDLPGPGTYDIRLALGDAAYSQSQYAQVLDGDTVLLTIGPATTASTHWLDAAGADRTAASWPTDNVTVPLTFSTSILRIRIGTPSAATGTTALAHLRIEPSGPPSASSTPTVTPTDSPQISPAVDTPTPTPTATETAPPPSTSTATPAAPTATPTVTNSPTPGAPGTGYGFNFRGTSGYVADASDETYDLGAAYPVTRNGRTFGWETRASGWVVRNRSTAIDRRLAGLFGQSNTQGNQSTWRVDLPAAGTYIIRLALGDAGYAQSQYAQILDGDTVLLTLGLTSTASSHWRDASGADRTAATWPTENVAVSLTFSTTILRVRIGASAPAAGTTTLAHLRLDAVGTPIASPTPTAASDTPTAGPETSTPTLTPTATATALAPTATPTPTPTPSGPTGPASGFNFRSTGNYVSDASDETYDLGAAYPVTRNGRTFGWEHRGSSFTTRNRSQTMDRRLAGLAGTDNPVDPSTWRLDLPSPGQYAIRLAAGDVAFSQLHFIDLLDGDTVLASYDGIPTATGHWIDATGADRTASTWPADNVPLIATFSSSVLRIRIGSTTVVGPYTTVAHVRVDPWPLPTPTVTP
ncbi:hypothetical protein L6Q96_09330 [Candidatus Binatia bacterium]|nr:hypothetical protein [Candidatus Binatia bacterium]